MTVASDPGISLEHCPDAILICGPDEPENTWLDHRKNGITGSDVAALIGADPRRGPLRVFNEKRGKYRQHISTQLDHAARRGKALEPLIGEIFSEETGYPLLPTPGLIANRNEPWIRGTPDYITIVPHLKKPAVVECKSRNSVSGMHEGWTSDEPPDGPTIQTCWYMLTGGWQYGFIAGLVDDKFHWFALERDEEFLQNLLTVAKRFYYEHLLPGIPPPPDALEGTTEMLNHLWEIKPGAVKVIPLEEGMALKLERQRLKAKIAELDKQLALVENRMKVITGDAEHVCAPDGTPLWSWKADGNFAHARFTREMPETAEEYRTKLTIDLDLIKTKEPKLYQTFRSRVLRVS